MMELANAALVFFKEGGWLALFLASAWVNYKQWTSREVLRRELAEKHATEMAQMHTDSLAELKESRLEMKQVQSAHMEQVIGLFEKMASTADTMATYQRRANRAQSEKR